VYKLVVVVVSCCVIGCGLAVEGFITSAAAGVALTGYITKFRNKMKHNMDCNPNLETK